MESNLEQIISERNEISRKLRTSEGDYILFKAEIDSKLKNYESNQSRIEILANENKKFQLSVGAFRKS